MSEHVTSDQLAHINTCEACRAQLHAMQVVQEAFVEEVVPEFVYARIDSAIAAEARQGRARAKVPAARLLELVFAGGTGVAVVLTAGVSAARPGALATAFLVSAAAVLLSSVRASKPAP